MFHLSALPPLAPPHLRRAVHPVRPSGPNAAAAAPWAAGPCSRHSAASLAAPGRRRRASDGLRGGRMRPEKAPNTFVSKVGLGWRNLKSKYLLRRSLEGIGYGIGVGSSGSKKPWVPRATKMRNTIFHHIRLEALSFPPPPKPLHVWKSYLHWGHMGS